MTLATAPRLTNFEYLLNQKNKHELTPQKISELTEYGADSVSGWFAIPGTGRHRDVPDRAISLLKAKLEASELREVNRELKEKLRSSETLRGDSTGESEVAE
jgi:hypothetical protein